MKLFSQNKSTVCATAISAVLLSAMGTTSVQAGSGHNDFERLTIYFTRHAEKETVTISDADNDSAFTIGTPNVYTTTTDNNTYVLAADQGTTSGKEARLDTVCGNDKCAEQLSVRGELQAQLLAEWLDQRGITNELDAVYATHKTRTQQTVAPAAAISPNVDGVVQLPAFSDESMTIPATELNPEGTTPSECATLTAIQEARMNGLDTILIAGHSGTLYDIMGAGNDDCTGLGLITETSETNSEYENTVISERFPRDSKNKVKNFGDLWKVVINRRGEARFVYRKLLKPVKLKVIESVN